MTNNNTVSQASNSSQTLQRQRYIKKIKTLLPSLNFFENPYLEEALTMEPWPNIKSGDPDHQRSTIWNDHIQLPLARSAKIVVTLIQIFILGRVVSNTSMIRCVNMPFRVTKVNHKILYKLKVKIRLYLLKCKHNEELIKSTSKYNSHHMQSVNTEVSAIS